MARRRLKPVLISGDSAAQGRQLQTPSKIAAMVGASIGPTQERPVPNRSVPCLTMLRQQSRRFGLPVLPVVALLPSFIWLLRDRSVWPFDQAWYGQESIELYVTLRRVPREWPHQMASVFGIKAPAIAWIGQLFVPLGQAWGSIELGLLTLIVLAQAATLVVLFATYRAHSGGRVGPAIVGSFAVAAAPLFVAMTHEYFVEPLQCFAVAWFLAIMTFGRRWQLHVLVMHLVGAAAFALLVKVSSPIYCIAPGLVGLWWLFKRTSTGVPRATPSAQWPLWAGELASALLAAATLNWYVVNWVPLTQFVADTSSGSVALLYGVRSSFPDKLAHWLVAIQQSFFYPPTLLVLGMLTAVAIALLVKRWHSSNGILPGASLYAAVAGFEVWLVLALFSLQVNEEQRYLLPLAPYVGVLVTLLLTQLRRLLFTLTVGGILVVQWTLVYAQALGFTPPNADLSYWLLPPHLDLQDRQDVANAVSETCTPGDALRYNVVGVELGWFNANSFSFFAAQRRLAGGDVCYYTALGFAETDPNKAWQRMFDLNVDYFITVDPNQVQISDDVFNRISSNILERTRTSALFTAQPTPDHGRFVIFKHQTGP
jgi:hypothetical protein